MNTANTAIVMTGLTLETARAMIQYGPFMRRIRTLEYAAIYTHMRDPDVMTRFWTCVQPLLPPDMTARLSLNRRVLLTAYMVLGFPTVVFRNPPTLQELELMRCAGAYVAAFEEIVLRVAATGGAVDGLAVFQGLVRDYYNQFIAWKNVDTPRVIRQLEAYVVHACRISLLIPETAPMQAAYATVTAELLRRHRRIAGVERNVEFAQETARLLALPSP